MKLKDWKYRIWLRINIFGILGYDPKSVFSVRSASHLYHVMKSSKRRRQFSCEPWQVWILRLAICNQGAKYGIKSASNTKMWHQKQHQHQNLASKAAPTPKYGINTSLQRVACAASLKPGAAKKEQHLTKLPGGRSDKLEIVTLPNFGVIVTFNSSGR